MDDFVTTPAPNGESLRDVFKRTERFMNHLRKQDHEKVLIITHAGIIRCIWVYVIELKLENIFKLPVDYNELFVIHLGRDSSEDFIKRMK